MQVNRLITYSDRKKAFFLALHTLMLNRCFEIEYSTDYDQGMIHECNILLGCARRVGGVGPAALGQCSLPTGHRTAREAIISPCLPACHSLSQRLTLLSLSVVSRWFASTHCHPSVRPWPIKLAPVPISLLQLCWLFLDSIPPLISSSEISLHGGRGLVVGWWGLEARGGVG